MGDFPTRRTLLALLAAAPFAPRQAQARDSLDRLIGQGRAVPDLSQRIALISRNLLGTRYVAHTLVGGWDVRERLVIRDDAFDCVTFVETVLAAAQAHDRTSFEATLRQIRYAHGVVRYDDRNHYFANWTRSLIAKGLARPVDLAATPIARAVRAGDLMPARVAMAAVPRATLLTQASALQTGDVLGFVSRRPTLDVFHCGLVIAEANAAPVLRHASQSRGRVVDEPLAPFLVRNGVSHVTLARPVSPRATSV